jgi:hypothetical protein
MVKMNCGGIWLLDLPPAKRGFSHETPEVAVRRKWNPAGVSGVKECESRRLVSCPGRRGLGGRGKMLEVLLVALCVAGLVLLPLVLLKVVLFAVLLPFKVVGALFKALFGVATGLAGLAFGLVVALVALVAVPLLLLALPLLPFLVVGALVWLVARGGRARVAVRT